MGRRPLTEAPPRGERSVEIMDRRIKWSLAVVAVLVAGLIAGIHLATPVVGGAPATKITVKEFAFTPKTITTQSGARQLTIVNRGAVEHTFVIDELNVKSPRVKPGQSVTITVNLKKGTYQAYCDVPGHQEVGMIATVVVK
jgi:plastocyanin